MAGELLLDRPADGVLRLTISNPAKRNALDQAILDAIAAVLRDIGDARAVVLTGADGMFSSGYDIGDIPDDVFAEEAENLVAHPFAAALEALDACTGPDGRGAAAATRSAAASSWRSPATCASPPTGSPRHAARQARPRLLAHRPAALPGRHRGAAHARALPHRAQRRRARRRCTWGLVNDVVGASDLDGAALDLAAGPGRQRPAQRPRQQARDPRAAGRRRDSSTPTSSAELIELREASFHSEDMREGIRAFGEKRPARWKGR